MRKHVLKISVFPMGFSFSKPAFRFPLFKESNAGVGWAPILADFLIDQYGSSLESLFVSSANSDVIPLMGTQLGLNSALFSN
jgi:hypothetical protein